MKTSLKYLFLGAAIAAVANATPTLYINDGSWLAVAGGSTDTTVNYSGTGINGIWDVTVDIGTVLGAQGSPELVLNFSATSKTNSSTALFLDFVDTNLGPTPNGYAATTFAATTSSGTGTLTYTTNITPAGGATTVLTSGGPYSQPSFTINATSLPFSSAGLYTLGEVVRITSGGQGYTVTGSLDLVDPVPVPDSGTTLMLLGAGLTGLGLVSRLRRRLG
jgi:VPDSG-CTERM motif